MIRHLLHGGRNRAKVIGLACGAIKRYRHAASGRGGGTLVFARGMGEAMPARRDGFGRSGGMGETDEARLKRMAMRSWRRGTKEMDLVLGPWADAHLAMLDAGRLAVYDRLLEENDQDLMAWILGQGQAPAEIAPLLAEIADYARARLAPKT
jgi:antitoxin CptB